MNDEQLKNVSGGIAINNQVDEDEAKRKQNCEIACKKISADKSFDYKICLENCMNLGSGK